MKGNVNEKVLHEARKLIGSWLRDCREEKGLTQIELGKMMELNQATIAKIENGKWSFSVDMLTRFCVALDVYLFLLPKDSDDPLADEMRNRWGQNKNLN